MFVSLADPNLIDIYKLGSAHEEMSLQVAYFLGKLSVKPYAEKLSVVTSVGQLFLTTALTWNDNCQSDVIRIREKVDKAETLILLSYHINSFRKSVAERLCSIEEAIDYVDLYVMRLLETKYGEL